MLNLKEIKEKIKSFKTNNSEKLDLSKCNISDSNIDSLFKTLLLDVKDSLVNIDLSYNSITAIGMDKLIARINQHKFIIGTINLNYNEIDFRLADYFDKLLNLLENSCVTSLVLTNNVFISDKQLARINQINSRNFLVAIKKKVNNAIFTAILDNDAKTLTSQINNKEILLHKYEGGNYAIHIAAKYKADENIVNLLVEKMHAYDISIDIANTHNETPLMVAAFYGNIKTIDIFLKNGAQLESKDADGDSVFNRACEGGHLEVVKYLATKKIDTTVCNAYKENCLFLATENQHYDVVCHLLEMGIPFENPNVQNKAAIIVALDKKNNKLYQRFLFERVINAIKLLDSKTLKTSLKEVKDLFYWYFNHQDYLDKVFETITEKGNDTAKINTIKDHLNWVLVVGTIHNGKYDECLYAIKIWDDVNRIYDDQKILTIAIKQYKEAELKNKRKFALICAELLYRGADLYEKDQHGKNIYSLSSYETEAIQNELNDLITKYGNLEIASLPQKMTEATFVKGIVKSDDKTKISSRILGYYEHINQYEPFKIILKILYLATQGLHDMSNNFANIQYGHKYGGKFRIFADLNSTSVERMLLHQHGALGVYAYTNTVYFGLKKTDNNPESEIRNTAFHEIGHFVIDEIFKNQCKPYFSYDNELTVLFNTVLRRLLIKAEIPEIIQNLFSYDHSHWHAEFIVRIFEFILTFEPSLVMTKLNELDEDLPNLFEKFISHCRKHLMKLEERKIEKESSVENLFELKISKELKELQDLQNEMQAMTENSNNKTFEAKKKIQELEKLLDEKKTYIELLNKRVGNSNVSIRHEKESTKPTISISKFRNQVLIAQDLLEGIGKIDTNNRLVQQIFAFGNADLINVLKTRGFDLRYLSYLEIFNNYNDSSNNTLSRMLYIVRRLMKDVIASIDILTDMPQVAKNNSYYLIKNKLSEKWNLCYVENKKVEMIDTNKVNGLDNILNSYRTKEIDDLTSEERSFIRHAIRSYHLAGIRNLIFAAKFIFNHALSDLFLARNNLDLYRDLIEALTSYALVDPSLFQMIREEISNLAKIDHTEYLQVNYPVEMIATVSEIKYRDRFYFVMTENKDWKLCYCNKDLYIEEVNTDDLENLKELLKSIGNNIDLINEDSMRNLKKIIQVHQNNIVHSMNCLMSPDYGSARRILSIFFSFIDKKIDLINEKYSIEINLNDIANNIERNLLVKTLALLMEQNKLISDNVPELKNLNVLPPRIDSKFESSMAYSLVTCSVSIPLTRPKYKIANSYIFSKNKNYSPTIEYIDNALNIFPVTNYLLKEYLPDLNHSFSGKSSMDFSNAEKEQIRKALLHYHTNRGTRIIFDISSINKQVERGFLHLDGKKPTASVPLSYNTFFMNSDTAPTTTSSSSTTSVSSFSPTGM